MLLEYKIENFSQGDWQREILHESLWSIPDLIEHAFDKYRFKNFEIKLEGAFLTFITWRLNRVEIQNIGTTGWKARISLSPEALGRGLQLLIPMLESNNVAMFKISNLKQLQEELKYPDPQIASSARRFYGGMQVTFYIPSGEELRYQKILEELERVLIQNQLPVGVIDRSDRQLGRYVSIRHAGTDEYVSAAAAGGQYKAANIPDPFSFFCNLQKSSLPDTSINSSAAASAALSTPVPSMVQASAAAASMPPVNPPSPINPFDVDDGIPYAPPDCVHLGCTMEQGDNIYLGKIKQQGGWNPFAKAPPVVYGCRVCNQTFTSENGRITVCLGPWFPSP